MIIFSVYENLRIFTIKIRCSKIIIMTIHCLFLAKIKLKLWWCLHGKKLYVIRTFRILQNVSSGIPAFGGKTGCCRMPHPRVFERWRGTRECHDHLRRRPFDQWQNMVAAGLGIKGLFMPLRLAPHVRMRYVPAQRKWEEFDLFC